MNKLFQFPQTMCCTERGCLDTVALLTNRDGVARNCHSAMLTGNGSAHIVKLDELKRIAGDHVTIYTDDEDDDITFSFKQMTDDEWQAMLAAVRHDYLSAPRTYLMRWNPAISSVNTDDYDKYVVEFEDWWPGWNWSIWEHEDAMRGDRYFMLREGDGIAPGIYYAGDFTSDPFPGEDWRGTGKQRYYVEMDIEHARLSDKGPWLTTEELEAAIPSVNWRIGHSGELLTPEVADKLHHMWEQAVESVQESEEEEYTDVVEVEMPDLTESQALDEALYLMRNAHCEQTDKAGKPYLLHPLRVAHNCQTIEQKTVALLHDVIEDGEYTVDELREYRFPERIVEAVEALTRNEDESYEDFIERCAANPLARYVKIRDLRDNLDVTRLETLDAAATERINKYLRALNRLE